MPADQLNVSATTPGAMADGVLAVLAGTPLDQVAGVLGIEAGDLADAVETYQQAGHAALVAESIARDWYQVHVEFPDWEAAEKTVVSHLGPELRRLHDTGVLAGWWFIRKAPCWRLRMRPGRAADYLDLTASMGSILDGFTNAGLLSSWRRTLYEPEAAAFGGQAGMDIAHEMFRFDSNNILAFLQQSAPSVGRRELSVLLCGTLLRAAGQEWFECGDVWSQVARLRPLAAGPPADQLMELTSSLRKLLTCDVHPDGALFGDSGPLCFATSWSAAFQRAGRALRAAADQGNLERGMRDILAYHLIFHWNRLGLSTTTQSLLANAATAIILGS